MVETNQSNLTEDEADLYDRQIRLWGLDSQKRLRASSVLLIGLKGLGAEFCKNIVLAGIKSITLLDDSDSTQEDAFCQFLIPQEQIGTNRAAASHQRAQQLNPMVNIEIDKESVDKKPDKFFTQFSVVVSTDCNLEQLLRINKICHEANVKFYSADVFGFYGYLFADLQTQEYAEEKTVVKYMKTSDSKKKKLEDVEMKKFTVKEVQQYSTLQESLKITEKIKENKGKRAVDTIPLFLLKVLLKFRTEQGRNPKASTRVEDLALLKKLRDSEMNDIGVSAEKVPDEYLSLVFSQMNPVCAILGGELAYQVIKALSQNGEPHNNFFFLDPIRNHGIVIKNC